MPAMRDPVAQALEVRAAQLHREAADGGNPGRPRAALELLADEFSELAGLIDGVGPTGEPVLITAMRELGVNI